MKLRPALAAAALFAAGPALAAEPEPQAPVATAQPSVAEQIDAFLRSSRARDIPSDGVDGVVSSEPERRVRGEVFVGVGSHGYRSFGARTHMPIGETGSLSLSFQKSEGRGAYGPYGGWYGPGLAYGAGGFHGGRAPCAFEDAHRPLDVAGDCRPALRR